MPKQTTKTTTTTTTGKAAATTGKSLPWGTHVVTLATALAALGKQPAALPNTVNMQSLTLVNIGPVPLCIPTYKAFLAQHGGKNQAQIVIVQLKGMHLVNLPGQTSPVGTTRGNCLNAAQNGFTLPAARAAAKYGPPKNPKQPQKPGTKPSIATSIHAQLCGSYNQPKYQGSAAIVLCKANA